MGTRVVHRVRVRKKTDSQTWVDIKVVDAITVLAPGGKAMLLWTRAKDAVPLIIDKTGDDNGVNNSNPTRVSHMERVHGEDDPQQMFDIEVLDAVAFQPPHQPPGNNSGSQTDEQAPKHGLAIAATFGRGPFAVIMPPKDAIMYTVDKTGLELGAGSPNSASRSGHINIATEKGNTDKKTDGIEDAGDSIPPKKITWCATLKTDAINFKAPHGANICLLIGKNDQDEIDITKEVDDPDTGDKCPPDNTDPNKYICFPDDSKNGTDKSTGLNVGIPINKTTGKKEPINQGPLWWIDRVSPAFRPWFWFAEVQTPLAFSYFGSPGRLGSWAWRGFVLWNNYPVIWILSANNAIVPMGTFGSPTLELCATDGDWDYSFHPVPSGTFGAPGRPAGSTVQFPFSAIGLIGVEAPPADAPAPFGPFGMLAMTHVPLGKPPDKQPYGIDGDGSQLWDGKPNIWQLTGLEQPKLAKPDEPWDAFKNPYLPPSLKKAEEAAKLFKKNWNIVAKGHNEFIQAYVGGGGVTNGGPSYSQPPGWAWAIPWFDGSIGAHNSGYPSEGYRASFQNGIPPGVATRGLPIEIYTPATAWTLDIDQLDRKKWDTTHLEFYNNPINYFLPLVLPPQLWSDDAFNVH